MKKLLSVAIVVIAVLFTSCASKQDITTDKDTMNDKNNKDTTSYQIRFDGMYRTEANISLDGSQISISMMYRFFSDNLVVCGVMPTVLVDLENIERTYTLKKAKTDDRLCIGEYTLTDNNILVTEEGGAPYTLVIANIETIKSNDALILLRKVGNEKTLLYKFEAFDGKQEDKNQ